MSTRVSNVIGTSERISKRRVFETDYDPNKPPFQSKEREDYQSATSSRRAVRYMIVRMGKHYYRAHIVGPFHSSLYGVCGFGTSRGMAKAELKRNLANNHGFIGSVLLTSKDEADNIGVRYPDELTPERPITLLEACGSAGQ